MHVSTSAERAALSLPSLTASHGARPGVSPARLVAEACWVGLWHAGESVARGAAHVTLARRVARERAALAALDDARLADVGLDRAAVRTECARRWMDVPAQRLRRG